MDLKNICPFKEYQWAKTIRQAKATAKELDQEITKTKNTILHYERDAHSILFFPHFFINKWQFDEDCGWIPSDQINWPKAIALSPFFAIYHILAAPKIVYDQISKYAAQRHLHKMLEKQKQTPDPRLVFGKLHKLMEHPEQLKATSEQGLAPREFVDFITNNLKAYKQLKSLPSGKPWRGQSEADPKLVEQRRVGMAPIREKFNELQREIYRVHAENKVQKLTKKILQQDPNQSEPGARKRAIDTLRKKYEKTAPHYYLFSHTHKEYKSYNMLKALK